jgi:hypothetical protein
MAAAAVSTKAHSTAVSLSTIVHDALENMKKGKLPEKKGDQQRICLLLVQSVTEGLTDVYTVDAPLDAKDNSRLIHPSLINPYLEGKCAICRSKERAKHIILERFQVDENSVAMVVGTCTDAKCNSEYEEAMKFLTTPLPT